MKNKLKMLALGIVLVSFLPSCMMTKCRYNRGWRIETNIGKVENQIEFHAKKADKIQLRIAQSNNIKELVLPFSNNKDSLQIQASLRETIRFKEQAIGDIKPKFKNEKIKMNKIKQKSNLLMIEREENQGKNSISEGTNVKDNYLGDFIGGLIDGLMVVALVILAIAIILLIFMLVQVAMVDWILALILLFLIVLDILFFNGELTFSLLSSL